MSGISTHVLDTARGQPAAGIPVTLERQTETGWTLVGAGHTDDDGRVRSLTSDRPFRAGVHRITFEVARYHAALGVDSFFPRAAIEFVVRDAEAHFHVPLLLSPFAYSTYRGS